MHRKRTIDKEEWVDKTSTPREGLEMVRRHKFYITQRSAMIEDEVGNTQLDQLQIRQSSGLLMMKGRMRRKHHS